MKYQIAIIIIFGVIVAFVLFMAFQAYASNGNNNNQCNSHNLQNCPSPSPICGNGEHVGNPHCHTPTPHPTATVSPTPVPTINPCDIWKYDIEEPCPTEEPSVTPTPTPISTPSATPVFYQDNSAPSNSCVAPTDAPKLQGFKVEDNGDVTFSWWPSTSNFDDQTLVYGCSPDNLIYGVNGIDKHISQFTIHDFKCNGQRYAQVWANSNGCVAKSNILDP